MNPLTIEWVEKAEGDFITSTRELRARNAPILMPFASMLNKWQRSI